MRHDDPPAPLGPCDDLVLDGICEESPAWLRAAHHAIRNAGSYATSFPSADARRAILAMLDAIEADELPEPRVVVTRGQGLKIEWAQGGRVAFLMASRHGTPWVGMIAQGGATMPARDELPGMAARAAIRFLKGETTYGGWS